MKQPRLPRISFKFRKTYGGSVIKGKRKIKRPFQKNKFMHLVFRSDLAVGKYSMLNKQSEINRILYDTGTKYSITLEQFTNAGNNLHLLARAKQRADLQKFLKSFARQVARLMVGLNKKFWTSLVFSRIVEWGRDLKNAIVYIMRNYIEHLDGDD